MKNLLVVDGDFVMDAAGNLATVEDDAELAQEISLEFQENRGEYFLEPDIGFRKYDILGSKFDRERAIDAAYEVILGNARIESVEEIEAVFDREKRRLQINWVALKSDMETMAGEETINANGINGGGV